MIKSNIQNGYAIVHKIQKKNITEYNGNKGMLFKERIFILKFPSFLSHDYCPCVKQQKCNWDETIDWLQHVLAFKLNLNYFVTVINSIFLCLWWYKIATFKLYITWLTFLLSVAFPITFKPPLYKTVNRYDKIFLSYHSTFWSYYL